MNRYILILLFNLSVAGVLASGVPVRKTQPKEDTAQLKRIAGFGKVWGVINYFHPNAGKGKLTPDSLFVHNAGELIRSPTSENFRKALKGMFMQLGDPQSGIINTDDHLPATYPARKTYYKAELKPGCSYIAIPQEAFKKRVNIDSVFRGLQAAQSFVIDLRNSSFDYNQGLSQYANFVQPLAARLISRLMLLPVERSFYYKGLLREDFSNDVNILPADEHGGFPDQLQVYFGLRNVTAGAYLEPNYQKDFASRRFCFIINRYVNVNTLRAIMALRNRNLCNIVFDGPIPDFMYGGFFRMQLPDNVGVKIKTSELIYEDGTSGPAPDQNLQANADTSLQSPVIAAASKLLQSAIEILKPRLPENTVYIRKPQADYPAQGVPDATMRLLGLFNFWNAIHYFSPNKD